jgi:hypothetical protein
MARQARSAALDPRKTLPALLALGLTAIFLFGAPSARAAEPGVVLANQSAPANLQLSSLGTHWVRLFATWPDLEPASGDYAANWIAAYEETFRKLPPGTKVLLDVVGTPQWETGSSNEHAPPANPNDYAAFVAGLAQRLDAPGWWVGAPNPAAYAQLLKATYPAIKAADPSATVVLGGMTGNDYPFLEALYAAGAKGSFDAVGVHTDTACNVLSPYEFLRDNSNRMIPNSFLAYREVHAVMLANGDDKPIWMTELSWRTTSAVCSEGAWAGQKPEGVSEAQQATYLSQAYHCLAQDPYVQVALWFPLEDQADTTAGLMRADGSHKPSFTAMRSYAHDGDQLSEQCGNFTGPAITVSSPSNHVTYAGPLPIHVSARSAAGVFRIRLEVDGKLIRNYDGSSYPTTLSGAITWQGAKHISYGRHILTFLAYDKQRNVSRVSVAVYRAKPKPKHKHRRRHQRHSMQ